MPPVPPKSRPYGFIPHVAKSITDERAALARVAACWKPFSAVEPDRGTGITRVRAVSRTRWIALAASLVGLVLLASFASWRWHVRNMDQTVCAQLQLLDSVTHRPDVLSAIQAAGRQVDDRLGHIVRSAEGGKGSLNLASEDYDYVITRCIGVGVPAPHVDPAGSR